jgi:acetyl esterase/lipase
MKIGKLALKFIGWRMGSGEKAALKHVVFDRSPNTIFDIPYSDVEDERLKFDLLKSSGEKRKNVLLIDIHGGAYYHGHRSCNYAFSNYFREQGYDVVVADYRLTDASKGLSVKTEVQDLLKLFAYLEAHLKDYGLENDKLVIMGDSAGGHFAMLTSEICLDENLQKKWGVDANLPKISATVVCCPVYDFTTAVYSSGLSKSGQTYMYGLGYEDEEWTKSLDPREHIKSLSVPVFVSSCFNDFLKEHSIKLDKELNEFGAEHSFVWIETKNKKVGHVHNVIAMNLPESKKVNEAIVEFLESKV